MYFVKFARNLWQVIRITRPKSSKYDVGRSLEYVLRLLPFYYWVSRLLMLFNNPRLQFIPTKQPAVLGKIRKPYQDKSWAINERYEAIRHHYLWTLRFLDQAQLTAIYAPESLLVTTIHLTNSNYAIKLLVDNAFDKEGELSLTIFNESGDRLAILTFSIINVDGHHVMLIGGLQGGKDVAPALKKMAKDCYGLRVMALIVHVAQIFAQHAQLKAVYAISDAHHIYSHRKYRRKKQHKIQRIYDDLWLELGGVLTSGWYELPLNPKVRDLADAPSHKRSMYAKRNQLLINLKKDIGDFFTT